METCCSTARRLRQQRNTGHKPATGTLTAVPIQTSKLASSLILKYPRVTPCQPPDSPLPLRRCPVVPPQSLPCHFAAPRQRSAVLSAGHHNHHTDAAVRTLCLVRRTATREKPVSRQSDCLWVISVSLMVIMHNCHKPRLLLYTTGCCHSHYNLITVVKARLYHFLKIKNRIHKQ